MVRALLPGHGISVLASPRVSFTTKESVDCGFSYRSNHGKQIAVESGAITTEVDNKQVEERVAGGVNVVYEAIRREGEVELGRPAAALTWSALAAGLSIGFSFIVEALIKAHLPDAMWAPLITKSGYSVGFLIVVLGRQQLFTESTLTVVLPVLLH